MTKETVEIRWHGRGGQGLVTAAKMLAEAALEEGKHFQALPDYGAERMGAPIRAYTRISAEPILPHCQVTEPDAVVVFDPTLLGAVDVTEGLPEDGVLLVNTPLSPAEVRVRLNYDKGRVYTVDATGISIKAMGRNFPNSAMLGALARVMEVVRKESLVKEIKAKLGATVKRQVVEANVIAFDRAYEQTTEG